MKFIFAVVMLAFAAVNTNASVLPLAHYPLPLAYSAYAPHISLSQGPALYSAYSSPIAVAAPYAAPYAVPSASYAVAAPIAVPSASYVATTRGAQHVAPLPGHVQSVSSQNLEAAPGTL